MLFTRIPAVVKKIFPHYTWQGPAAAKSLYLTFDDGPHPTATPFVLDKLKACKAQATFFCIGKNVIDHPDIYARIQSEGHSTGNHTHNHYNGWRTGNGAYIDNVMLAQRYISTTLFRPPYGKINPVQAAAIRHRLGMKIIMWDVLSGDYSRHATPEQCLQNVLRTAQSGSIIVFHDSTKAFKNMSYALPRVLDHFAGNGYRFLHL